MFKNLKSFRFLIILLGFSGLIAQAQAKAEAAATVFSITPVMDKASLSDPLLKYHIRNDLLRILVNDYGALVLSRSNGIPLLEEQWRLASARENPETFPYPAAADYIIVPEIRNKGKQLLVDIMYSEITGNEKANVKSAKFEFKNEA